MSTDIIRNCQQQIGLLEQRLINFLSKNDSVKIESGEFMKAYDCVSVVNAKGSRSVKDELFEWCSQIIQKYINKVFIPKLEGKENEDFLDEIIKQWENFKIYIFWMNQILKIFDQSRRQLNILSLSGNAFQILQQMVFQAQKQKINSTILQFLEQQRQDQIIPQEKLHKLISYLIELGHEQNVVIVQNKNKLGFTSLDYQDKNDSGKQDHSYFNNHFKQELLQNTKLFYEQKALQWGEMRAHDYVQKAIYFIEKEIGMANQYFEFAKDDYIEVIDKTLILENMEKVAKNPSSGIKSILQHKQIGELDDMYSLFKRKKDSTFSIIAQELYGYVEDQGKKFISDRDLTKKPLEYIKTVISFKEEVDDIVKNHLENNIIYQNARDSSFKVFLNKFDKTVRYLAMHTDKELKSDLKGLQDEEVDQRIQSIKGIFLYLYSKDQFIQDYSVYLSKRLLNQTSISDDWENKMISSLKAETGHTMVFKLTQMCQDVQLSKSKIKPEFKEYLQNNLSELEKQQNNIEANIMVLTRSLWPIKTDFSKLPKIPDQLQHIVKHFENYYGQNFAKNRRLQFLLKEGKSEIKAQFQNQKKILIVSNFQLSILLTFNNVIGEKITYGNLLLSTQIPGDEIREHLLSLIKLKILEREDQDLLAPIKNEEKISVNENFANQQMKIKCIPGKEFHKKPEANTEQEKINQEQINQQRNYVIEATIVRVMKSKRVLTVNEICQDTISLINMFKPEIKNIKERIDDLIAREYLQRDEKNKASIIYKP